MQGELEILVNELRVQALEVVVRAIASLHHSNKSIAQVFLRHPERNDVCAISVARFFVVQPPSLLQPNNRMQCSNPQKESSKRGLMSTISAITEADDHAR
jgi:hypothetical protein